MKKTRITILFLLMITSVIFTGGCQMPQQKLETWQIEDWRSDLEYLRVQLPEKHVNLFFSMSEDEFNRRIDDLEANLPDMNEDEIIVEMKRIVTAIGDEHTGSNISAKEMFPLDLMWLSDGWYVINTTPEYDHILYCRLTHINDHDIQEVESAITDIISHSNESWLKAQMKFYFPIKTVLHGLGFMEDRSKADFTFINSSGEIIKETLRLMSGKTVFEKVIGKGIDENSAPLYMKNNKLNYWYEVLSDQQIIYFKYNACQDDFEMPYDDFEEDLNHQLAAHPDFRLVIDLRDNQGGDSSLLDGWINMIASSDFNQEGKLFVFTGRKTFSSAVLNAIMLKVKTEALFIGEPTGGKPIHYGETSSFRLPESKIHIIYSTKYFTHYLDGDTIKPVPFEDDSLAPDITIEAGIEDFRENRDVLLEYVTNH